MESQDAESVALVLPTILRRRAKGNWAAALVILQDELDLKVVEDSSVFLVIYKTNSPLWCEGTPEQLLALKQSRGAIFEKATYTCVCLPFLKFWSHGETLAATLPEPWSKEGIHVREKCDGSLAKLYYFNQKWRLASNTKLNVDQPRISMRGRTCRALFEEAAAASGFSFQELVKKLDPRCCYLFELMHPDHIIVVPYAKPRLVHIGTRDMTSLCERFDSVGLAQPREFQFASLKECALAAENISWQHGEGYVIEDRRGVRDGEGGSHSCLRLKVKSLSYLRVHHATTDTMASDPVGFCLDTWLSGEGSEILAYFPQFQATYRDVEEELVRIFMALMEHFNGLVKDSEGARSAFFKRLRLQQVQGQKKAAEAAAKGKDDYWQLLKALAGIDFQALLEVPVNSAAKASDDGKAGKGGALLLCVEDPEVLVRLVKKRGKNNRARYRGLLKRLLLARLPDSVRNNRIAGKRSTNPPPQKLSQQMGMGRSFVFAVTAGAAALVLGMWCAKRISR